VDQDKLIRLARQGTDMVKQPAEKARQPDSGTGKHTGEFQKLLKQ
jgi:hypothetical protein